MRIKKALPTGGQLRAAKKKLNTAMPGGNPGVKKPIARKPAMPVAGKPIAKLPGLPGGNPRAIGKPIATATPTRKKKPLPTFPRKAR